MSGPPGAGPAVSVMVATVVLLTSCTSSAGGTTAESFPAGVTPSTTSPAPASARPSAAGASRSGPAGSPASDATGELLAAAYANDVSRAEVLIRAGGDVNAKDASQQSAFLIATSEVGDDPRLLELTLAAGADVLAKDSYNGTGLIRAAQRGYPRIVAWLLAAGVAIDHVNRLDWIALLEAVVLGDGGPEHTETVRLLIDGGADVNLPDSGAAAGSTHAQRRGQRDIARLLQAAAARR